METITKILFVSFAFVMLCTSCSKNEEDAAPKVAMEITAKELVDYFIIEEFIPKPENVAVNGTKPILFYTFLVDIASAEGYYYLTRSGFAAGLNAEIKTNLSYSIKTGITTLKTIFGAYELTRNENNEIVVKQSNLQINSSHPISQYFQSNYIQLVKKVNNTTFSNATYKEMFGSGYYSFYGGRWRYKQGARPPVAEITWQFGTIIRQISIGKDGGSAKYHNLFIFLPKGNGWKGEYEDKDLLIVNTLDNGLYKAVGDIGVYSFYTNN